MLAICTNDHRVPLYPSGQVCNVKAICNDDCWVTSYPVGRIHIVGADNGEHYKVLPHLSHVDHLFYQWSLPSVSECIMHA